MDLKQFEVFDEESEIRKRKDFESSFKLSINSHFDKLEVSLF